MNRDLEAAWKRLNREFPFRDYVKAARRPSYVYLPSVLHRWRPPPARVLDFGAGPCDKTFLFSALGYQVTAFDDLLDPWHVVDDNRTKILRFARDSGIAYITPEDGGLAAVAAQRYDVIMLHHVLEHLHDSPRDLLCSLVDLLEDGGLLYVSVPNAVNLRKRLSVLAGRTNYQDFGAYYWASGPWRGHVREYTAGDIRALSAFLGLDPLEVGGYNHFLHQLPGFLRRPFDVLSAVVWGWRDSVLLVAKKPSGWVRPLPAAHDADALRARIEFFKS